MIIPQLALDVSSPAGSGRGSSQGDCGLTKPHSHSPPPLCWAITRRLDTTNIFNILFNIFDFAGFGRSSRQGDCGLTKPPPPVLGHHQAAIYNQHFEIFLVNTKHPSLPDPPWGEPSPGWYNPEIGDHSLLSRKGFVAVG